MDLLSLIRLLLTMGNSHRNEVRYRQRLLEQHRRELKRDALRIAKEKLAEQLRLYRETENRRKQLLRLFPLAEREKLVSVSMGGAFAVKWSEIEELHKRRLITVENNQVVLSALGREYLSITEGMQEWR